VSSSDFRQITIRSDVSKAERLFRAAVSAFCSLTRPSRRDIAQLEDLTLPLYDLVSADSRRYVAAALSESPYAPAALVRRLCNDTVDIAAPLLIRSKTLKDIDLIVLIGRHGYGHARAIGRRPGLNPIIAQLVAALDRSAARTATDTEAPQSDAAGTSASDGASKKIPAGEKPGAPVPGGGAENARRRLRSMMRPSDAPDGAAPSPFAGIDAYPKLRDAALTGNQLFFHTALADALSIDLLSLRRAAASSSSCSWLIAALRALDFNEESAFLISAAVYPSLFAHPEAIRLFLSRYRALHPDMARDRVRTWKAASMAATIGHSASRAKPLSSAKPDGADGDADALVSQPGLK
jgi:uncharacterized protein (DUF2336 family)